MPKINHKTKENILKAAEVVFHENGFKGARTTAIAKKAGISRTMLHYYYSTKEDLFQEIVRNSFGHFVKHAQSLFDGQHDLKSLIEKLVDMLGAMLEEKPGLPTFIVNILNETPELVTNVPFVQDEHLPALLDELLNEARKKKEISSSISGENLLINIYGLCSIPYQVAPLIKFKENRTDAAMETFMKDRLEMIKSFVWKGIQN